LGVRVSSIISSNTIGQTETIVEIKRPLVATTSRNIEVLALMASLLGSITSDEDDVLETVLKYGASSNTNEVT
jgi:hypothetical protein